MATPKKSKPAAKKLASESPLGRFVSGRLGRLGFILGFLYYLFIVIGVLLLFVFVWSFLLNWLNPHASQAKLTDPIFGVLVLCYLATILWNISLYVRRLHDVNRPGWLAFLGFIPFANIVFSIYLLVVPGSDGDNDYGEPMHQHDFYSVTLLKRD